ncbi:hypothetical protein RSSM_06477 [Rhodopirellula sallentina SM41]|uniref:Uncharacterized protein n=1 Tax=Rhodopirellula sallentina SM41 TaxID=1263870 RepID=M5U2J7_9BACT|nr:hypothetical protein RSSM_06477 [Rhodopirellula sallentina SM41]
MDVDRNGGSIVTTVRTLLGSIAPDTAFQDGGSETIAREAIANAPPP